MRYTLHIYSNCDIILCTIFLTILKQVAWQLCEVLFNIFSCINYVFCNKKMRMANLHVLCSKIDLIILCFIFISYHVVTI